MKHRVSFAFVYIMEAHASDEWPIGNLPEGCILNQHTTLEERLSAARMFLHSAALHPAVRVLVDPIHNPFNQTYESWPTRAWVILKGKVTFKSMPGDGSGDAVNVVQLSSTLDECCAEMSSSNAERGS